MLARVTQAFVEVGREFWKGPSSARFFVNDSLLPARAKDTERFRLAREGLLSYLARISTPALQLVYRTDHTYCISLFAFFAGIEGKRSPDQRSEIPATFQCSSDWARRCNLHRSAKCWFAFAFYKRFPSKNLSQKENGTRVCPSLLLDAASDHAHRAKL